MCSLVKMDWYWFYGTGPMQRGFEKTLRRLMDQMTPKEVDEMLVIVKRDFRGKIEFFPGKLQKMIKRKMRGLDEEHFDHFGNFKKPKPKIKPQLTDEECAQIQEMPEWARKCIEQGPMFRPPVFAETPADPYWYTKLMTQRGGPKKTRSTSSKNRLPPRT